MTESDAVWLSLFLAGAAYETYTLINKRSSDTLSETTRSVFRVRKSKTGRAVFLVGWLGFATWYTGHIMEWWA